MFKSQGQKHLVRAVLRGGHLEDSLLKKVLKLVFALVLANPKDGPVPSVYISIFVVGGISEYVKKLENLE